MKLISQPAKPAGQLEDKPLIQGTYLKCSVILGILLFAVSLFGHQKLLTSSSGWQLAVNDQDFRFPASGRLKVKLDPQRFSPWIDTQIPTPQGLCSNYRIDGEGVEVLFWDGTKEVVTERNPNWYGIRKGVFHLRGTGIATVTVDVSECL